MREDLLRWQIELLAPLDDAWRLGERKHWRMQDDLANEQNELVETLDTEALFDYLVQNGVLDTNTVNDIKNANEGVEVSQKYSC